MYYYRLYYLDSKDHHVDVRDFRANSDLAAIIKAGLPCRGESRQLWNRGRRVMELCR